jgi:hypothetical protein
MRSLSRKLQQTTSFKVSSPQRQRLQPPKAQSPLQKTLHFAGIDRFRTKSVDLNGDGVSDVSHGKMTRTYLGAEAAKGGYSSTFKAFEVEDGGPAKQFLSLAQEIREGTHYDGVSVSLSLEVPLYLPDGKLLTDPKGKAVMVTATGASLGLAVYRGDAAKQAAMAEAAKNSNFSSQQLKDLKHFYSTNPATKEMFLAFGEMAAAAKAKGVPVGLSAGNSKRHFNGFSLHQGVTAVGSVNANGKKSAFSSDDTHSDAFGRGVYNVNEVPGGLDVTGDKKVDVFASEVSRTDSELGLKQLQNVHGRKFKDVAAKEKDYQAVAEYYTTMSNFVDSNGVTIATALNQPPVVGKVFNTERLAKAIERQSTKTEYSLRAGESRIQDRLRELTSDKGGHVTFTNNVDKSGLGFSGVRVENHRVMFDPDGSKGKAINVAEGTSYAQPTWLGQQAVKNANAKR